MNDCNNQLKLPDYLGNCWLNAIILCVLYSEYSRNLLINEIENLKTSSYLNLIKELLISYYTNKKTPENFFKLIDPSLLLFQIFNTKENFKISEYHIVNFYKYLGIKTASIAYLNIDNKDIYISKEILTSQPDVIVFFHEKLNNYSQHFLEILKTKSKNPKDYVILSKKFEALNTYSNEINFNGISYILSSCLATDNSNSNDYHSIAGIYCNKTRYVYNGFNNKPKNPCSLFKYDWDINKNELFCLNPNKCELDIDSDIKKLDNLCFNFGNGNRTLIYIRKDKTTVSNPNYKIEDVKDIDSPIIENFNQEITNIKELSIIGLLDEIEKIKNKSINLSKIKAIDFKRYKLENFILKYKLKKDETKKSNSNTNDTNEKIKNKDNNQENIEDKKIDEAKDDIKKDKNKLDSDELLNKLDSDELLNKLDSDLKNENKNIEILGGKQKTKKELLQFIDNYLNKITKNKLLIIYNNLKKN